MRSAVRKWFLNQSLNNKLILIFSIPLTFLITVSVLTVQVFKEFDSAEDLVARSTQIREQSVYFLELLYSAQNAFRGYVLTEDASYLARFDEAKGDVDLAGLELARLVQDSPLQSQRDLVADVQTITRRLIDEENANISQIAGGARQDATAYIKSGKGQESVEIISSLLSLFQSVALQIQRERQAAVDAKRVVVWRVIVGGTMLTLLLTGLGVVLVTRSVTKPMGALVKAAAAIGTTGTASFPDLDRHDEVGVLSRSMAEMDRQIRAQIKDLRQSEAEMVRLNRNLSASEHQYRSLVENVPLGIFTTRGNSWTFANRFERTLMGLPDDAQPAFADWEAALHNEDRARVVRDFRAAVERCLPFECDFRFMRADGSVRHIMSRGLPVADSASEGAFYLCLDLDVTKMVELQQRLAPAERLATLTRMATSIAHDLRTPLLGIEQGLKGLKYVADGQLDREGAQLVEDLHTGARLAVGVVQDILDLYRQAYGELPLSYSSVVLQELADDVVELMGAEIRDRRLSIAVEGQAPPVWADQRRLFRVLVNLLDNAMKNSPNGGCVRVRIETIGEKHDSRVTVAVEDEGRGLDPLALETLFEPSRPVSTPTRGGTGLGLYLCRLVISAHKGSITAQNRPEGGARFMFEIPIDRREAHDDHPDSDRRRPAPVQAQSSDGP